MKSKPFINHKKVQSLFENMSDEKKFVLREFIRQLPDDYSHSKKYYRSKVMSNIIRNNSGNYEEIYKTYINSKSKIEQITLIAGSQAAIQYSQKLKTNRPRPSSLTCRTKEFWIKRGLDEKEALRRVSDVQRKSASQRSSDSYKGMSHKLKSSIDYWMNMGYNKEESEILKQPYLNSKNDLSSMIERHGYEEGIKKYNHKIQKYKKSMMEGLPNRKQAGYVSYESKKFFMKLYRKCRKMGIPREQIYFGVSGSREFFIRDNDAIINKGGFFDFTIPSIGVVIEYNGIFWHARDRMEWKNPWTDYNTSYTNDAYKASLVKKRGFTLFIVWSDQDKNRALNMLEKEINARFRGTML